MDEYDRSYMDITLQDDERVLLKSHANHYVGRMLMTGRLFLTNRRLCFVAHPLNFRQYTLDLPLATVTRMEFRNNLRFFSHGFWVHTANGEQQHFSVWNRRKWKKAVEEQLALSTTV